MDVFFFVFFLEKQKILTNSLCFVLLIRSLDRYFCDRPIDNFDRSIDIIRRFRRLWGVGPHRRQ